MSILVDSETKVIVQGITGREGSFHTRQMLDYGVKIVAGVTPGKAGNFVEDVPVYHTIRSALEYHEANTVVLFVPPLRMCEAAIEAIEAHVPLIVTLAEGVPVHDMFLLSHMAHQHNVRLIGPNSFGIISPGKSKVGFMAHRIFKKGSVGMLSRSATNAYETVWALSQNGIGQSTVIGVGGDMIPGSSFIELLPMFQEDDETKVIVLIGEIGGNDEELAAAYIANHVSKPVVALIAGKNAPKGRSMGHAGAIISANGDGSAWKKEAALREAGVYIAESTFEIPSIVASLL